MAKNKDMPRKNDLKTKSNKKDLKKAAQPEKTDVPNPNLKGGKGMNAPNNRSMTGGNYKSR